MRLEEKIAQMIMIGFRGTHLNGKTPIVRAIERLKLGNVWLTDNESPMGETLGNISSIDQVCELTHDLQSLADIPLFIAIDAEGGEVIRLKEKYGFPRFPSPQEFGTRDNLEYTRDQSTRLAALLAKLGINFNFSPVLDLNKNPNNPVIGGRGRAISANAAVVIRHARIIAECMRQFGVLTLGKHFPGHGSSTTDSHLDQVDISETWDSDELEPYKVLITENLLDGVLPAHIMHRRFDCHYPASLSAPILQSLLRHELNFQGLIVSDDLNMGAIGHHFTPKESVLQAVNAGVNILLYSNVGQYDENIAEKTLEIIHNAVIKGQIPQSCIDESVQRILNYKNKGLPTILK